MRKKWGYRRAVGQKMCTSSNPLLWFFKRDSDAFFLFLIRKKRVVTMPAAINRAITTPAIMPPFEATGG
jgi:hypothetical protein